MKRLFRYFELSKAEQRGFMLLSLLFICSLSFPYVYDFFREEVAIVHELHVFEKQDKAYPSNAKWNSTKKTNVSNQNKVLTVFDPNGLSITEWQKLGLSLKQAQVIKNYEAKGGQFRKKEDLARIYSISADDYERLAPFIQIEPSVETTKINNHLDKSNMERRALDTSYKRNTYANLKFDINKSDTSELDLLKGIGTILAKRIVKYREALGGFVHVDQLSEVYGLPSETYSAIRDKLYVADLKTVKLNVNKATIDELAKHPYINRKQAQWIVNYRLQHGSYESIKSLTAINLLEQGFLRKIAPYLEF